MKELHELIDKVLDKHLFLNYYPSVKNQLHDDLVDLLRGVDRSASHRSLGVGYEAAIRDIDFRKEHKL